MSTKTTLPISEARKKIFEIAEDVQKPNRYYTLTEKGRPKAVILSVEEFDSLVETIEILSNPKAMRDIKEAEEQYKKGEYISWDELKKEMKFSPGEKLILRDEGRKRYSAKKKAKK